MSDYKIIEEKYQQAYLKMLTNIPEPEPKTEEGELQEFIRDYIDEMKPETIKWNAQSFATMYGGMAARHHSKNLLAQKLYGQKSKLAIIDESSMIKGWDRFAGYEKTSTFKPTKKQAKLLRKFRKLKRFKGPVISMRLGSATVPYVLLRT